MELYDYYFSDKVRKRSTGRKSVPNWAYCTTILEFDKFNRSLPVLWNILELSDQPTISLSASVRDDVTVSAIEFLRKNMSFQSVILCDVTFSKANAHSGTLRAFCFQVFTVPYSCDWISRISLSKIEWKKNAHFKSTTITIIHLTPSKGIQRLKNRNLSKLTAWVMSHAARNSLQSQQLADVGRRVLVEGNCLSRR